ncbi:MAG TPA: MgtC/SapB family protein [Erysipelothrix sp.]|jgi:putative Mg2+ transporter-C (MgtC) family protein|nr:MgtC/SapB family protein [Erysipelothrix sp.]
MEIANVLFRLFLAALCGAVIGSDRVVKGRPAGIKTHALVALGACVAMITGEFIVVQYGSSQDVARLAAQVISGIGFLGAGTIMVTGQQQVLGLTTAAGLWFAGTLGISVGGGYYEIVAGAMLVWVFIFFALARLDTSLSKRNLEFKIYLSITNGRSVMDAIVEFDRYNFIMTKREPLNKEETLWILYGTLTKSQEESDLQSIFDGIDGLEVVEILFD